MAHWSDGPLVLEKAPPGASSPATSEAALRDIPGVRKVFETAPGPGQNP